MIWPAHEEWVKATAPETWSAWAAAIATLIAAIATVGAVIVALWSTARSIRIMRQQVAEGHKSADAASANARIAEQTLRLVIEKERGRVSVEMLGPFHSPQLQWKNYGATEVVVHSVLVDLGFTKFAAQTPSEWIAEREFTFVRSAGPGMATPAVDLNFPSTIWVENPLPCTVHVGGEISYRAFGEERKVRFSYQREMHRQGTMGGAGYDSGWDGSHWELDTFPPGPDRQL